MVFEDTLRRICRKDGIVEREVKLDALISELASQGNCPLLKQRVPGLPHMSEQNQVMLSGTSLNLQTYGPPLSSRVNWLRTNSMHRKACPTLPEQITDCAGIETR